MRITKLNINKFIDGTILNCSNKSITHIEYIPEGITSIYCYNNQLTSLPKLPSGLKGLSCSDNQLTSLPMLPDSLNELICRNNQLTSYPNNQYDKQWMLNHNKLLNRIEIINKINDHR